MTRTCILLLILCTAPACAETVAPRTPRPASVAFTPVVEPITPEQAEAAAARHPACAPFGPLSHPADAVPVTLASAGVVLRLPSGFHPSAETAPSASDELQVWVGPDSSGIFLYPFDGTGAFSFGIEGRDPVLDPGGACSARFADRLASVLMFTAEPKDPGADTLFLALAEVVLRPGTSLGIGMLSPTREGRSRLLAAAQSLHAPEP